MSILSNFRQTLAIASHGLPPLLAIVITETVNVEMTAFTPFGHGEYINFVWQILQGLVGWVFGWFSDKHWRKNILIGAQLLGVFGGSMLIFFGFNPFVMLLVGLTFAPLPVSRAALMDAYPAQSMVKIMAITFFAQWLPWAFYSYLTKIPYVNVMYFVLCALLINSLFTYFSFKEDVNLLKTQSKQREDLPKLSSLSSWRVILFTFIALGLAELTFFQIADNLENNNQILQLWWPSIGFMTFLGNFIAMFYRSRPSISILSGCYLIGACFCMGAIFNILIGVQIAATAITMALISYSLIGGMYLPLSYSVVLNRVSPLHKGAACGALDLVELAAALGAAIILQPLKLGDGQTLVVFMTLYLLAAFFQKYAVYKKVQKYFIELQLNVRALRC